MGLSPDAATVLVLREGEVMAKSGWVDGNGRVFIKRIEC